MEANQREVNCIRFKDDQKTHHILQCVELQIFQKIINLKTLKKAWDTLLQSYQGAKNVQKMRLQTYRKQFELIQQEKYEKITDYFMCTQKLVNTIKENGKTISDVQVMEKIL